jgi:hypothetical protein
MLVHDFVDGEIDCCILDLGSELSIKNEVPQRERWRIWFVVKE